MRKKLVCAGALIVLLTGTALAQFTPSIPLGSMMEKPPPTPEELARQKAIDNAYRSATKKIPDKKPAADPWGDLRNSNAAAKNKQ